MKRPDDATVTAEHFAEWAETLEKDRNDERYNAACIFALCAAAIEKNRETLIDKSLALLRKAKSGGYFDE